MRFENTMLKERGPQCCHFQHFWGPTASNMAISIQAKCLVFPIVSISGFSFECAISILANA